MSEIKLSENEFNKKLNNILTNRVLSVGQRVIQANQLASTNGKILNQEEILSKAKNSDKAVPNKNNNISSEKEEFDDGFGNGEIVVVGAKDRSDHRIRLSAFRGQETQVYGVRDRTKNILEPLWDTQGLLFPYTPSVQVSQDTSWQSTDLEHANYDILSFQKASSATLSVTGRFSVQNQREGQYTLAAIHFLRTVSKAYFGAQDVEQFVAPLSTDTADGDKTENQKQIEKVRIEGKAGLPPPVLLFSGYGNMMFNDLKVVVRSHSWSFDENADLIKIELPNNATVWLPPLMSISMSLAIQQNTDQLRENFNLDEFRTGELLKSKGWF